MFDLLINENQHECLGVTPDAVKDILDFLKDKIMLVKRDFQEYEDMDQQFQEIRLLRQHCQEIESDRDRLQTYEQSYLQAENNIKDLNFKL